MSERCQIPSDSAKIKEPHAASSTEAPLPLPHMTSNPLKATSHPSRPSCFPTVWHTEPALVSACTCVTLPATHRPPRPHHGRMTRKQSASQLTHSLHQLFASPQAKFLNASFLTLSVWQRMSEFYRTWFYFLLYRVFCFFFSVFLDKFRLFIFCSSSMLYHHSSTANDFFFYTMKMKNFGGGGLISVPLFWYPVCTVWVIIHKTRLQKLFQCTNLWKSIVIE